MSAVRAGHRGRSTYLAADLLALVLLVLVLLVLVLLAGCSSGAPSSPASSPVPAPSAGATAGPSAEPSASPAASPAARPAARPTVSAAPGERIEPTTTNTLPPPPEPTGPAPSTAGDLNARVLPVPAGWRTVVRQGGEEQGFEGNGTWVRARDARYAAQDVITIGCADVTRDDYPDPARALEGSYENDAGAPGIGLVLQFDATEAARAYWSRYAEQVRACSTRDDPVHTEEVAVRPPADGEALMDRRTYPDGKWTEIGVRRGDRVTLVILNDRHRTSRTQASQIVDQTR